MNYCYNCDKNVEVRIEDNPQLLNIKGVEFDFVSDIAICQECGEEVYILELENAKIKKAFSIYTMLTSKNGQKK